MKNEKLTIHREAAKRMIEKNMDLNYIHKITDLSKKEIKNIANIKNTFIGHNEYYLRKSYASKIHLNMGYWEDNDIKYFTGVVMDKSDFYKNLYRRGLLYNDLPEDIEKMKHSFVNTLKLEANLRINTYFKSSKMLLKTLTPIDLNIEEKFKHYDLYFYIKEKYKKREHEKIILNLLSVEENLKKIAFICDCKEEFVEKIKNDNKIFFKNDKLDLNKMKKEQILWENELQYDIFSRLINDVYSIKYLTDTFDMKIEEVEKFINPEEYNKYYNYSIREDIAKKLIESTYEKCDIDEISGVKQINGDFFAYNDYYNRYLSKVYEKYADEELIVW